MVSSRKLWSNPPEATNVATYSNLDSSDDAVRLELLTNELLVNLSIASIVGVGQETPDKLRFGVV